MNKEEAYAGVLLVIVVIAMVGSIIYLGNLEYEPYEEYEDLVFVGVTFTSTNNSQVQLANEIVILGEAHFRYYDLPYTKDVYWWAVKRLQYWFKERYRVNETFQDFIHGPFTFNFNDEQTTSITYELNKNDITALAVYATR